MNTAAVPAPSPLGRAALRAVCLALLCAALQALLPRYTLGATALAPLNLVLGVMVAAGLSRGRWTVPAALLGAMAGDALAGTAVVPLLGHAALLAVQTLLMGWLMRHADDAQLLQLDDGARLRRFALHAAAAAATLGAAGAMATAAWADSQGLFSRQVLAAAAGRWVADWAAIVIVAPVLLCWLARQQEAWRLRRRPVAWPLLLLMAVMLPGIDQVARRDELRLQVRFDRDTHARQQRLQQLANDPLAALLALRGMLAVGGEGLGGQAFDPWAGLWMQRNPGLLAAGWLELGSDGAAPALRHLYASAAGSDQALRNAPALADAARQALADQGAHAQPVAPGAQTMLLTQALPADGNAPRRVMVALLDLQRQLEPALPDADDPNLRLCVYDGRTQATSGLQRLAGPEACQNQATEGATRTQATRLTLADRRLDLLLIEPPGADNRLFTAAWLLALPTLTGMALLAVLLLALTGRLRRIEDRVRERTAALHTEIDERRQAERVAAESEQRFRAIFDSVPIGVTLVDNAGTLTMVNPAFCRMMGCEAAALLGRPLDDIRLPDVHEDDGTAAALGGGGATRQRYLTTDGRMLQVAASLRTLHDASGAPVATVGALQDLTQVLRLREAERERDEAAIAIRTKSEFLARLSHELRAPLNAILGFAQMLDDAGSAEGPATGGSRQRGLAQIRQAGWHLLDMINDVLDLSRMEAGSLRLHLEPVALPDLAQEAMAMVEPAALAAGVTLSLSLSPQAEWVQADPMRLRQVLVNLLSNAVKYNRRGGTVELRTRPAGVGELRIEVEDSGQGIPEERLGELFTPFHRLGRERGATPGALHDQGTGIGLVICRKLLELMAGDLEVSSRLGEGSVFGVRLPRAAGDTAHGRHSEVLSSQLTPLASQVAIGEVLYIEDDARDTAEVQRILGSLPGVSLRCVATAADGLARAALADLVLLDLDLPDRPGIELLRTLRADPRMREVPVIVVSAETRPQRIDDCIEAGAAQFLAKPIDAGLLLRAVEAALKGA
ncbi:ATP-binding protein [Aquabacterium sp. OR-4]|uniref:ATP-binding protein n=1 Tax=Aquabacterium sp. OR-4 TaxID=2978127 RepID=UPI0028CAE5CC|nr:ATP-binding protein [Aquabacterium sp. OR-4]MDT7835754.1 ATP-binding protein [Aquabacterium sp. OR-4]